jgi:16S rRNA (uracil1498-N3)-methyltransferase
MQRHVSAIRTLRLFFADRLVAGTSIVLRDSQAHYLAHVMRLGKGATVRIFNGTDGEWLCEIMAVRKKEVEARCDKRLRAPTLPPDIDYLFAPLKHARIDYVAQKATEMGVRRLRPVLTRHTAVDRVNVERLRANAIEAAEQCNLVGVPEVLEPRPLDDVLAAWEEGRRLVFCDEAAAEGPPLRVLAGLPPGPLALVVGPEGGFAPEERDRLLALPFVAPISLGPRVMRADTAAVAALALIQATLGDWR